MSKFWFLSGKQIKRWTELQEAGKELAEAEIAFVQAKKRKQELEAMKSGVIARRDNVSDEIISSMFS